MKIVFLDKATLGDSDLSVLENFGQLICYENTAPELSLERVKDADIVITNKVKIDREILENSKIKLICVAATGTNNIDLIACQELGVAVKNVAGYSTPSVVQQCFAGLLYLRNHCKFYDDFTSSGQWSKSSLFTNVSRSIFELKDKRFGIIGLGTIGLEVAKIAKSFGCKVSYYSTSQTNKNSDYESLDLQDLLKNSDIISIHCALSEKTFNLIGQKELGLLKDGAILMNFGRGGIVNEAALAREIDKREIYAVLDVTTTEPVENDNELLKIQRKDRIFISPHIAWASVEARQRLIALVAKNIEDFLKGK